MLPELLIVLDTERLQLFVALVDVGVTGAREIATVDVGAGERVADAFVAIEVGIQNLPLLCRRQLRECFGGCIGERATDADNRLQSLRGVHEDADLSLQRLSHGLERQLAGG